MKITVTRRVNNLVSTTTIDFGEWVPTPEDAVRYLRAIDSVGGEEDELHYDSVRGTLDKRVPSD